MVGFCARLEMFCIHFMPRKVLNKRRMGVKSSEIRFFLPLNNFNGTIRNRIGKVGNKVN